MNDTIQIDVRQRTNSTDNVLQQSEVTTNEVEVTFSGCDNYYNGEVMPCLMRPWLPPFSYSTTEGNNGEYKRKRRAARTWRAI